MVIYIIEGLRWFDKVNGNTYHTVNIIDAEINESIYKSPVTYGYDDQYKHTALDWLIKKGLIFEKDRFNHELMRKMFYFNVVDVRCKKEL